jgi:hypothetical protein
MNHIDMYEQITSDMDLNYEVRSMIRNLHNMTMNDMLKAKWLINEFVNEKHNNYMLIHANEISKKEAV